MEFSNKTGDQGFWADVPWALLGSLPFFMSHVEVELNEIVSELSSNNAVSRLFADMRLSCDGKGLTGVCFFIALLFLIRYVRMHATRSYMMPAVISAALFSLVAVISSSFAQTGGFVLVFGNYRNAVKSLLLFGGYFVLAFILLRIALTLLEEHAYADSGETASSVPRYIIFVAFTILAFWVPYYIVFFPGTTGYDGMAQICQFFGLETFDYQFRSVGTVGVAGLTSQQPLLHTMLLGGFVSLGEFPGSQTIGFGLFILFQMLLTALSLSISFSVFLRWGVSDKVIDAMRCFVSLCPYFPLWAINASKNALQAPLFLLLVTLIYDCVLFKSELSPRRGLAIALLTAVNVMLVKTCLYALVLYAVVLFFFQRDFRALAVGIAVVSVVTSLLLGIVCDVCGIAQGGSQEAMGILIQQTARYVTYYEDDVTESEREVLNRIFDYEEMRDNYNPSSVDKIKDHFILKDLTTRDYIDYLSVWAKEGLRHPGVYLSAAVANSYGFFDLNYDVWFANSSVDTSPLYYLGNDYTDIITVSNPEALTPVRETVWELIKLVRNLPVFGTLLGGQIYVWFCIMLTIVLLGLRGWRWLPEGFIVWIQIFLLLISPVNGHARYMIILSYSSLVLLALALSQMLARDSSAVATGKHAHHTETERWHLCCVSSR